jgi:hypothetical protein
MSRAKEIFPRDSLDTCAIRLSALVYGLDCGLYGRDIKTDTVWLGYLHSS